MGFMEHYFSRLLFVAIITYLSVIITQGIVNRFLKRTKFIEEKKRETFASLYQSVSNYLGLIIVVFFAINPFVDVSKILAGAGVVGIVLGIGAQSIIKDILTGFFLLYEKQVHIGDYIEINGKFTGTVEEIGLRIIKVREWSGKLLHIANGEIKELENYNMEKMRIIEKIVVSYREDPERLSRILEEISKEFNEKYFDHLAKTSDGEAIEPFKLHGITNLNANYHGYEYTMTGLVDDKYYWNIAMELRKEIARKLYENEVKMAEKNVRYQARMHL
jgi:small-conductance mechanosensitive channel